jgi:hypothetical protein
MIRCGFILFPVFVIFTFFPAVLISDSSGARVIELILDASGSMNAKLPDGQTRIDAAKKAVGTLVENLPPETQLAFRVYGHQSPREKHDCNDTQLVVPFGPLSGNKRDIVAKTKTIAAQGYTPITKVITLAASDFAKDKSGERVIILVSDGKETCEGDPCTAARALHDVNVNLVIHTIGFAVDTATRYQLKCIANATGGSYFDAEDAGGLSKVLGQAAVSGIAKVEVPQKGGGYLEVKKANMKGHKVFDAETGKQVAEVSPVVSGRVNLPAGIYHVQFGTMLWKSVEVRAGETTVLEPGYMTMENPSMRGHKIQDSETGQVQGEFSGMTKNNSVLPGIYDISFGPLLWKGFKIDAGQTLVIRPGLLIVNGATMAGHRVYTEKGEKAGEVSSVEKRIPLPPGNYTVELGGKKIPFTLAEGQEVVLEAGKN